MNENMDDEFEFKPLTQGLGFHKKVVDLREENATTAPVEAKTQFKFHPSVGTQAQPQASNPAQRLQQAAVPASSMNARIATVAQGTAKSTAAVSARSASTTMQRPAGWTPALKAKDLLLEKALDKAGDKVAAARAQTTTQKTIKEMAMSWPSAIFDSTMILGLTLLFSAVVFAVTGIGMADLIEMLQSDNAARIAALILLFAVVEIYTVTCRSFFGKTVGEWTFECRLGTREQQSAALYPFQVAFRSLIVAITGFVLIPLISTIIGTDVAGKISGVSIQSEQPQ